MTEAVNGDAVTAHSYTILLERRGSYHFYRFRVDKK